MKGVDNIVADGLSRHVHAADETINAWIEFNVARERRHLISAVHNAKVGHTGVENSHGRI